MMHMVVDAANVIGSRPDGWWRDRPGAARRLAGQLVAALTTDPGSLVSAVFGEPVTGPVDLTVHVVLEGRAKAVDDLPTHPRLRVHLAERDGDTAIAELVPQLTTDGPVVVVTADRGLRERVPAATVIGPGTLLRALPGPA